MASVTSLDKDLRKLRLEKYTPAAANEARAWIEETLGERLPSSDLLEGLKDGVALCKLINLALPPPGVRFKKSAMPFVQMENISHFLNACQAAPLNLQQHDTFLTVDLYEQKDPAQVLQCLGAFSRAANAANAANFPPPIGSKTRPGGIDSPEHTGNGYRNRGSSITSNSSSAHGAGPRGAFSQSSVDYSSGRRSPTKSPGSSDGPVSSWSRREQESSTAPAWNIAQYGYMGGASQGNLGIAFGSRRQITNSGPKVPSLAEKERIRKEKVAEEERLRQEAEEQQKRKIQDEEERAKVEEERRWEAETQRLKDEERRRIEVEKHQWEEQERQWRTAEDKRRKEEEEAAARIEQERRRTRNRSPAKLHGQYLSQYQADHANDGSDDVDPQRKRILELERELEEARQREAEYERDRQGRLSKPSASVPPAKLRARSRSRPGEPRSPKPNSSGLNRQESWTHGEREVLHTKFSKPTLGAQHEEEDAEAAIPQSSIPKSPRPLPNPKAVPQNQAQSPKSSRPLPDPAKYSSPPRVQVSSNRTENFLANNPAPPATVIQQTYARELGATEERDAEDRRRVQSQENTKAGNWASKSLLEREMEMERQRQKEWEEAQRETAAAHRAKNGVDGIGGGIDGRWDVSQWSGFTGGDSQNKGSQGIGAGRRQIAGPRPLPNPMGH